MAAGRPKKKINVQQLELLAEKQWHAREIAAFFRVNESTIKRRFTPLIEECKQRGKAKLRDLQWRRALDGSDRILLHMSKHYLGQHDKVEHAGSVDQVTYDMGKADAREALFKANQERLDAIKKRHE